LACRWAGRWVAACGNRTTLPSRRIARLVIFVDDGRIRVVHGFIKKTGKTPADDLEIARNRMKEMKA
jgi:phage-related protein